MIEVNDLKFSYNEKPFLENISFTVGKGEILGFLGPSGAGKSTLQKILTSLVIILAMPWFQNAVQETQSSIL